MTPQVFNGSLVFSGRGSKRTDLICHTSLISLRDSSVSNQIKLCVVCEPLCSGHWTVKDNMTIDRPANNRFGQKEMRGKQMNFIKTNPQLIPFEKGTIKT